MVINAPHIHLILNHVPVLGSVFFLLLLITYLWTDNSQILSLGLYFFVVVALVTIAVWLSGDEAEDIVEELSQVPHQVIHDHEVIADYVFYFTEVIGLYSLFLIFKRRSWSNDKRRLHVKILTALMVVLSLLLMWVANLGGQINHPEIRPEEVSSSGVSP